ncbi:response regulator [Pedobacter steynii]
METIFIQETDESVRDVVTMIIEGEGYRVWAVKECSPELLAEFAYRKPGLAILDFKLTGECCIRICRQIKRLWPKLPVLAISCNSNIASVYRQFGFDGYLEKPFDLDRLVAVVRRFVASGSGLVTIQHPELSLNC